MKQLIYGIHPVNALLARYPHEVKRLYLLADRDDQRLQAIIDRAKQNKIECFYQSRRELDELLGHSHHQGVAVLSEAPIHYTEKDLSDLLTLSDQPPLLLILDGVQDPHNLGACLRSANAFNVTAVVAPKDRAAQLTPVVRKVACGAAELTPFIAVTNLVRTLRELKEQGLWLVGMGGEADQPIRDIDLKGPVGIVLGNEGSGLRQLTEKTCDFLAKIPMLGAVESLNVSVAAAIALYEVVRQRG